MLGAACGRIAGAGTGRRGSSAGMTSDSGTCVAVSFHSSDTCRLAPGLDMSLTMLSMAATNEPFCSSGVGASGGPTGKLSAGRLASCAVAKSSKSSS